MFLQSIWSSESDSCCSYYEKRKEYWDKHPLGYKTLESHKRHGKFLDQTGMDAETMNYHHRTAKDFARYLHIAISHAFLICANM